MRSKNFFLELQTNRARSPGIDALRCFFALWVMLAHTIPWSITVDKERDGIQEALNLGLNALVGLFQRHGELHPAVVGFIVLSGYCIHRTGLRLGSDGVESFAIRRALRILPVFFSAVAIGIAGFEIASLVSPSLATKLSGTLQIEPWCVAAKVSAVAALVPIHPCEFAGNAPLLTVMTESVLYAVYGATFLLAVRHGRMKGIWVLCAACLVASLIVAAGAHVWPVFYNWWQNVSLFAFLPYWWLGAALALPSVRGLLQRHFPALVMIWLVLAAASVLFATNAVVGECEKIVLGLVIGRVILRIESVDLDARNPLVLGGFASYSLYAFHAPIIYTLLILGAPWFVAIPVAIAAGATSFLFLERPLTRLGRRMGGAPSPVAIG